MTSKATIASLNKRVSELQGVVNHRISSIRGMVSNALGLSHEGKRNIYDVYGYPQTLSSENGFRLMYQYSRRQGIANRITAGIAKPCWRDGFKLYASTDDEAEEIEQDLIESLKKAKAIKKLEAADTLNRMGRLSVLFVGVPDGREPHLPVGRVSGGVDSIDKMYFSPYAYDGITISEQDDDPKSPRYGLPVYYNLNRTYIGNNQKDADSRSIKAHYTRVIHLNENALDSDIEGMGALEPVFNRILDLDKACGGSSEAYFRNAKGKISYEMDKDFSSAFLQNEDAKKQFQEKAEDFSNDYRDHIVAIGSKVGSVITPHYTPKDTVLVALWEIAGYTGIPIRVLTGEGSGQLAGSEDQLALNQIIKDRQNLICSGWVDTLLEIMTNAGMVSLPEGYEVRFEIQEAATDRERSDNADKKASAILKVTQASERSDLNAESALSAIGIEGIEFDDFSDDDEDLDESLPDDDLNAE